MLPLATACLSAVVLVAGLPPALAAPVPEPETDTAIWRAEHGLLLGITHAGSRIVAVGTAGHILLSDDDGASWRLSRTSPTDELLTAVVFPTPREGWAVGQDETILHSSDGGETWTQQYLKKDADQVLFTIISLAPSHLFSSGSYNVTLESQDGKTWSESKIPNTDDDYHLNCAINRGDDILVTGEAGHAFIRAAGSWTPVKLPYEGSQFACLLGPDGSFYSFGLRGTAFRMLPTAHDWTKIDTGTERSFFGAANLANGEMALVGANGLVDLLNPATGKITAVPPPTAATLSAVTEITGGKLIVVGEDGLHLVDPAKTDAGVSQ
jgi:photosystem II stability/assembly factor-like uncharacterized protein